MMAPVRIGKAASKPESEAPSSERRSHVTARHPHQDRNDDPTLTGHAGLLLTGELVGRLDVVETIEEAVSQLRERRAGPVHPEDRRQRLGRRDAP